MKTKDSKQIVFGKSDPFFLEEVNTDFIRFEKEDYEIRINALIEKMKQQSVDFVFIYADREHFSNIEYFSGFDPRFEEAAMIISVKDDRHIIFGTEGEGYSHKIPYDIERHLYQNFSLQGQIKNQLVDFKAILEEIGFKKGNKIGAVGYKYFETDRFGDPDFIFDIPNYIINDITEICGKENTINFTKYLTGLPDGVRMVLRTPKEIAWAEAASCRAANVIVRLLKNLKPGITELELARKTSTELEAFSVHPMINFGDAKVSRGLGSPEDFRLNLGDVCGIAHGVRGALTSRVGVCAYDMQSVKKDVQIGFMDFYGRHFHAMCRWYETIRVNCLGGELHQSVHGLEGIEGNNINLNCGHNIGTDEWTNSPSFEGSQIPVISGTHMQVDIISGSSNPVRTCICEDSVVIADEPLRSKLRENYPEVYKRIVARQEKMRNVLGIEIADDVLPLSNLNGVYHPFMLDLEQIFICK